MVWALASGRVGSNAASLSARLLGMAIYSFSAPFSSEAAKSSTSGAQARSEPDAPGMCLVQRSCASGSEKHTSRLLLRRCVVGHADDAAADAAAGVAGGLRLLCVGLGGDDPASADDRVRPVQLDHLVLDI